MLESDAEPRRALAILLAGRAAAAAATLVLQQSAALQQHSSPDISEFTGAVKVCQFLGNWSAQSADGPEVEAHRQRQSSRWSAGSAALGTCWLIWLSLKASSPVPPPHPPPP